MPIDDPEEFRADARDGWEEMARGWTEVADEWDRATRPVSEWIVEAIQPQPGQKVLELAAGPGDVGLLVAELLRPGGSAVLTDGAEAMVAAITARAEARGLGDVVEAKPMEAEWIDAQTASFDAVFARWGYMLLADPDTALRETRRVLRSGGVVALAAWAEPDANPWNSVIGAQLREMGLQAPSDPDEPGPFAWRDRDAIGERLGDAGFTDVVLDTVAFTFPFADLDAWWDRQIDLSRALNKALLAADPATRDEIMEGAQARLAPYVNADGTVEIPAATHVARAEA
jgi:ubiquinone/menaquinone biosynthesis C-methylase UbiE